MPTHFRTGVTNTSVGENVYNLGLPDPAKWNFYFNDFHTYAAGDWTITETGAGSRANTAVDGGALLITNAGAENDNNQFQFKTAMLMPAATKRCYFRIRFQMSEATQSDFVAGTQITNTAAFTAATVTDGIYFYKDDGSTAVNIVIKKDDAAGKLIKTSLFTFAATTWYTLGWEYDGNSKLNVFKDDVQIWQMDASATYFPNLIQNLTFAVMNGDTNARSMTIDHVLIANER
jgi:hypothetical protein